MTRQALITPRTPTQAEIDRAVGRGNRMRSHAFREAFGALFAWIGAFGAPSAVQSKTHAA